MKILFVTNRSLTSFERVDERILQSAHQVKSIPFRWSWRNVSAIVAQATSSDLVFGWFAGHHTYLPAMVAKVKRRPLIIAAADYDLANEPWFNYGSMRGGLRKRINNHIFKLADLVVVPSQFSREMALRNTMLGNVSHKVRVLPLGFEPHVSASENKQQWVTTVGTISSENWIRKGHREFVAVAARMPDVEAYLVGRVDDAKIAENVIKQALPNLRITGYLLNENLDDLLGRTKVYAQLSYLESFGASLAEAMVAGCVPVITPQGALPEVVGDCGYYADYGDIPRSCEAVQRALRDRTLGQRARERILDHFPLKKRQRELLTVIDGVAAS